MWPLSYQFYHLGCYHDNSASVKHYLNMLYSRTACQGDCYTHFLKTWVNNLLWCWALCYGKISVYLLAPRTVLKQSTTSQRWSRFWSCDSRDSLTVWLVATNRGFLEGRNWCSKSTRNCFHGFHKVLWTKGTRSCESRDSSYDENNQGRGSLHQ